MTDFMPNFRQLSVVSGQWRRFLGRRNAPPRRFILAALCILHSALCISVTAAPVPVYVVDEPVDVPPGIAPVINATTVVVADRFNVNTASSPPQPYQTRNTLYFTNAPSGHIMGSPGFRFDYFTDNRRQAMHSWVNQGTSAGSTWLMVWATNISSTAPIMSGPAGLVRLDGRNVDLARTGIRVGLEPGQTLPDGFAFVGSTQFVSSAGVTDLYWGTGTNNALNNQGNPMPLGITNTGLPGDFSVPCAVSPQHQVHDTRFGLGGGRTLTNLVNVPQFFFGGGGSFGCFKNMDAHAFLTSVNSTSRVVQVAFVSRNIFDTNSSAAVHFVPDLADFGGGGRNDNGATIVVEFGAPERDLLNGRTTTNRLYLIDRSAFTNSVLQRSVLTGTRKPNVYEVRRSTPPALTNGAALSSNAAYSPDLLYTTSFASNAVQVNYSGYRFAISSTGQTNAATEAVHPTNMTGRVEIIGDNVNLDRTRIRAESTAIIRAKNLIGNAVAQVNAPFNAFDLSAGAPLIISNLTPAAVQRLSGEIAVWSATWENTETNLAGNDTRVRFHVLMVDNELQTLQPVVITDLALRSSHVVIRDILNVRDSFFTDARDLHIAASGGLSLPFGTSWRATNAPNVINFTNDGGLNISGAGRFGTDRTQAYGNFINRGTNIASSQFIRAGLFENTGCILATGGLLSIEATTARILGGPASITTNLFTNTFGGFTNIFLGVVTNIPGKLQGNSDVRIVANDLVASNSYIRAAGALMLTVNGRLTDGGVGTSNYWAANAGFDLTRRPSSGGDLLGTHLISQALIEQQEVFHTWAAEDRGASAAGYNNNLALLKLTLDGASNTVFHFDPPAGQSRAAIYVDYLELLNWATNSNYDPSLPLAFDVSPNMTIYFANANISPSKIDEAGGGRLVWVSDFAGPLSSIDIVYPSPPYPTGTVVTANIALATSTQIDSDGDGIVNADDPDPFFIAQSVGLNIEISKSGDGILSWNALKDATNVLECADTIRPNNWVTVTNFVQAELTTRVRVRESLSQTNQRIYRVRVLK